MKLKPTTSLNDAMKRVCEGNAGAATVVGHMLKEYPSRALDWLHIMDRRGMYGVKIWDEYMRCGGDISVFLKEIEKYGQEA